VVDGLAATARVITAAAIMVVVFGSFVFEADRVLRIFGLGLAVAVLLDATLIRMLLVPAAMQLLGARNWWMSRSLDRLVPRRLSAEGTRCGAATDDRNEPETAEPVPAPTPVPTPQPVDG
jgi:RND superfamily putative drug exporter